ncbi:metallo-beta-lactamase domain protein [Clostridiales bacterium oral taxon 876 str. F0540]|nr:metallo-beta-lactamase domain protein [Clostridiales bacterium oral taxon 876 str. F0540]
MRIVNYKSLYQLTITPNLFPVNVYIIEEEKTLTLIDTGLSIMAPKILKFSDSLNKPITRILLTHCHNDHIGSLSKLKEALPNAKVIMSERESRFMNGDFSLDPDEPNVPLKGGYPKKEISIFDETIKNGDQIGSLTSILTPGHTPGMTSYWSEQDKILIVGDALQTKGGLAIAGMVNWTFPFPAMATWSKELAIKSAEKILEISPDVIAPGHGNLLHKPLPELEKAIRKAKK